MCATCYLLHHYLFLRVQHDSFVYVCSDQLFCGINFGCLNQLSQDGEGSVGFRRIKRHGVAGKPLDQNEVREVCRLAEVGKQVIEEAAFDLVRSAQQKPLLFSYCGDGTPLKLKSSFQIAFAEHHKHARSGYTGRELYCQGGFLRTLEAAGEPIVRALLKDPRPMAGKSAICAFNGLVSQSNGPVESCALAPNRVENKMRCSLMYCSTIGH